ncbi:MAG TPA: DUF4252 domain-containing protein [Bryobacteraceae bacterium]|nr:DUF4252 domain-containing protein [Bryobacteraceae bacterium]
MKTTIAGLVVVMGLAAQTLKLPIDIENLSKAATETVDVTLDGSMIRFAERFLSDGDADQAKAKRLLRGLNSIQVKKFEFAREGEYSERDLQSIRSQLQAPNWSRMVHVKGLRENTEVFSQMRAGEMTGLVVLSAEPRELTIVHIDGPIKPEDIASLSGHAGLPRWNRGGDR